MDEIERTNAFEVFEQAGSAARYLLRLYITGKTANSVRALVNARRICDEYLAGRYDLEVVDLYQQPERAAKDGIFAVPTLVRNEPGRVRRIIGDLSDTRKVLSGLEIVAAS
ncbi:MAG TPA: circadian clock KaiB family protein [Capsulimonadaceae bacterium]|nr:circadian clock KaiB family protein [Capsulimonadaceae bacterium]